MAAVPTPRALLRGPCPDIKDHEVAIFKPQESPGNTEASMRSWGQGRVEYLARAIATRDESNRPGLWRALQELWDFLTYYPSWKIDVEEEPSPARIKRMMRENIYRCAKADTQNKMWAQYLTLTGQSLPKGETGTLEDEGLVVDDEELAKDLDD